MGLSQCKSDCQTGSTLYALNFTKIVQASWGHQVHSLNSFNHSQLMVLELIRLAGRSIALHLIIWRGHSRRNIVRKWVNITIMTQQTGDCEMEQGWEVR